MGGFPCLECAAIDFSDARHSQPFFCHPPPIQFEFISEKSFKKDDGFYNKDIVFMPVEGYWSIKSDICDLILNPGDTFSLPKHTKYSLQPTKPGMAGIYKVIPTDDMPGSTHRKQ